MVHGARGADEVTSTCRPVGDDRKYNLGAGGRGARSDRYALNRNNDHIQNICWNMVIARDMRLGMARCSPSRGDSVQAVCCLYD